MRRKYLYDSPSESSAEVEAYLSACWGPDPQSGAAFGGLASKGLGPLPTMRGSALALAVQGGRVVLPLARAAAVSTGLRIRDLRRLCRVEGQRRHHRWVGGGGTDDGRDAEAAERLECELPCAREGGCCVPL